jgi:hypothetical protein
MYGDERKAAEGKEMAYISFIGLVASDRGARKIGVLSSTLFALAYAFAIGMIFRNPVPVPEYITVPQVILVTRGPIGQVPWLVVYVDRYWTISVNLEAALSMLAISTLIGLNASALYYISRRAACCTSSKRTAVSIFTSALPAFFGFFSCCGGGLVFAVLLSAGVLPLVSGAMLTYGRLLVAASIALLWLNHYYLYRSWINGTGRNAKKRKLELGWASGGGCIC